LTSQHAVDLSLLRLSRVYVSLQQQLCIGVTEIEPVVYIERHIVHLANIVKDQSQAVTKVSDWIKKGRFAKDPGTLDFLKSLDLKDIRSLAIALSSFLASTHVYHGRHAVTVSAAIVIIAIEGSVKYRSPSARDLADEMCKVYAASGWTAMERYREGQKVLLDWSEQLEEYDLSVREVSVSKAGRHTRNVDKRLEVSRLVRRVLDEEESLRAKRQTLGLELPSNLTVQKLSSLPSAESSGIEAWSRAAAIGDDAEGVGGTWDDLDDDDEDSELEDDPDVDPLSTGSRPSSPLLNTSSLPSKASASSTSASSTSVPPLTPSHTAPSAMLRAASVPVQHSAFQAPLHASSTSFASQQSLQHTPFASTSISLPPASHDYHAYNQPYDLSRAYSTNPPQPYSTASSTTSSHDKSNSPIETEDRFFENVLSALGPAGQSADSSSLTLLSRAAGALEDASNPAAIPGHLPTSSTSRHSSPLNPLLPSSRPARSSASPASSATTSINTLYLDPAVAKRQLRADAWTASSARLQKTSHQSQSDLISTMSDLLSNNDAPESFFFGPPTTFVHKGVFGGMRPAEYMRHRPSDLLKTNPYRHLTPSMIDSIRRTGQGADTPLGQLILAGHDPHTLPAHLAPHSTLGVLAALRSGGAEAVGDEELFVEGELEGYMRPDTEVEFVAKMWEDEGRWEGEEERARRREIEEGKKKRKRERAEEEEDAGGVASRRSGSGGRGRGRPTRKTKATQEMREKLAALAGIEEEEVSGEDDEAHGRGWSGGGQLRSKRSRGSDWETATGTDGWAEEEEARGVGRQEEKEVDPLLGKIDPELLRMEREMNALRGVGGGEGGGGSDDGYEY
jgi:hypothetical protein